MRPGLTPALNDAIDEAIAAARWPSEYGDAEAIAAKTTLEFLESHIRVLLVWCEGAPVPLGAVDMTVEDAVAALRQHYPKDA